MAGGPPTVFRDTLVLGPIRDGAEVRSIAVDSPAWQEWLAHADSTSFRFESGPLCFTARRRRGTWHWYATQGSGKERREIALGTAADLTLERLQQAAETLASVASVDGVDAHEEAPIAARSAAQRRGRAGSRRSSAPSAVTADQTMPDARSADRASHAGPGSNIRPMPLLATKLFIPPIRPNLVRRPCLLARLDVGLRGPLTVLVAPAGWGKTTLLAAWSAAEGVSPIAWVSLDAGDNDPVRFWTHVLTALDAVQPGLTDEALSLLRGPTQPPVESVLTLVLNKLTETPAGAADAVLVLDDYHVIESPAVHAGVGFLLKYLPPQLHLALATREDPPLPLARLRAQGAVTELRAADLRFTSADTTSFFEGVLGLTLLPETVRALDARSEGWIAGLQLAALSLQGRTSEQTEAFIAAFAGSNRYIVDYLVEEVLARQPPEIQTFLLRTAMVERFCAPLCARLLDGAETSGRDSTSESERFRPTAGQDAGRSSPQGQLVGQALLERVERANLFLIPLDDERRWYRYHHLFADALRSRLEQAQPRLAAELHRRASIWCEEEGLVEEAVEYALAADDFAYAADLVERHAAELALREGRVETALRWIDALPEAAVRARPFLWAKHGVLLMYSGRTDAAGACLRDAEAIITTRLSDSAESELRPSMGMAALLRALLAVRIGDVRGTVAQAQAASELLPKGDALWQALAQYHASRAYLVTGNVAGEAEQALVGRVAALRTSGNLFAAMAGSRRQADLYWRRGQLRAAIATYEEAICQIPPPLQLEDLLFWGPGYCFGLGELRLECNDLDEADRLLHRGMHLEKRWVLGAQWVTEGYLALAGLQQARGDMLSALATLDALAMLARQRGFVSELVERAAAARAHVKLGAGDLTAAVQWAIASGLTSEDAELPYLREQEYLTLARVRIAQGQSAPSGPYPKEALRLLGRLQTQAEAQGRGRSVLEILILRALTQQARRDRAGALGTLAHALVLAEPEGYVRLFVGEGAPMAALLTDLVAAVEQQRFAVPAAVLGYARALLAACRSSGSGTQPSAPGVPKEHATEPRHLAQTGVPPLLDPLTERELEVLRLLAEGASNAAIAATLVVTVGTVKKHVFNVCSKLAAQNRTQAVARARALRLL